MMYGSIILYHLGLKFLINFDWNVHKFWNVLYLLINWDVPGLVTFILTDLSARLRKHTSRSEARITLSPLHLLICEHFSRISSAFCIVNRIDSRKNLLLKHFQVTA